MGYSSSTPTNSTILTTDNSNVKNPENSFIICLNSTTSRSNDQKFLVQFQQIISSIKTFRKSTELLRINKENFLSQFQKYSHSSTNLIFGENLFRLIN